MKNIGAIVSALIFSAVLLNAKEEFEDKNIQVNDSLESNSPITDSSDSGYFTNNDSLKLSKAKTISFEKPMYFKNIRDIREAETIDMKFPTEGKTIFRSDLRTRKIRHAEDSANEEVITTLQLPLEKSLASSSDTTENPIDVTETSTVMETDIRASIITEKYPEVTTLINNINSVQTAEDSNLMIFGDELTSVMASENNQRHSSVPKPNSDGDIQEPILVNNEQVTGIFINGLFSQAFNVSSDAMTAPNVEAITRYITNMNTMWENTENMKTINSDEDEISVRSENKENDEIRRNTEDEPTKGLFDEILPELPDNNTASSKILQNLPSYVNLNNSWELAAATEDIINNDEITTTIANSASDTFETKNVINDKITTNDTNSPGDILVAEDIINNDEMTTTYNRPETRTSNDGEDDGSTHLDDFADVVMVNTEDEEEFHIDLEDPLDITLRDNAEIDNTTNNLSDSATKPTSITGTADKNTDIEATSSVMNTNLNSIRYYNYLVYGDSDIPCILVSMGITLKLTYKTNDKKTVTTKIQVPTAAAVNGSCGKNESYLSLIWTEGLPDNGENNVTFKILREQNTFYVDNLQVSVFLDGENFPNSADMTMYGSSKTDLRLFSGSVKGGVHVCHSITEVLCDKISVLIKDVSLIAYNDRHDVSYREEERCFTPRQLSIAAIAGGLIGIVVTIGIIASYAWYRKKTSTFRSELP